MNVSRHIDKVRRIVYTTISGEITMEGIRADMASLLANPDYDPTMWGLVDMRQATAKLTADDMLQLAYAVKSNQGLVNNARRALIVDSDLLYGLYRMFHAYASDGTTEYRVFREEKQAREWIENPGAKAE